MKFDLCINWRHLKPVSTLFMNHFVSAIGNLKLNAALNILNIFILGECILLRM
jgi:hypothetical protein